MAIMHGMAMSVDIAILVEMAISKTANFGIFQAQPVPGADRGGYPESNG